MSSKTTVTEATASQKQTPQPSEGHGNSPAAWSCVFTMLAGALLSSIAFVLANTPLFIAGVVVMVIGLIVGWAMRAAGYGVGGSKVKNSGH
ncbi:hypothetical protein FHU41_000336 [Psychromicrobium silvestre]|uniref:Uncharacterized protein n=1 Tax=Psychromicrobium silvestre TaxID=1645614 RepID=A0A7Y9S4S3_9MICC|nr:HGxxPAAW family protein [Psychromicrobium silvestre]NYE94115.1 hypothetical protein [Psychromicrobium silvestre]